MSTLSGIFDVMNAFAMMPVRQRRHGRPSGSRSWGSDPARWSSPAACPSRCSAASPTLDATDIVIVPSVLLGPEGWRKGRHPELVDWLRAMHRRGALLCSACSGIFLLAETGLFDGMDATVHFGYAARLRGRLSRTCRSTRSACS